MGNNCFLHLRNNPLLIPHAYICLLPDNRGGQKGQRFSSSKESLHIFSSCINFAACQPSEVGQRPKIFLHLKNLPIFSPPASILPLASHQRWALRPRPFIWGVILHFPFLASCRPSEVGTKTNRVPFIWEGIPLISPPASILPFVRHQRWAGQRFSFIWEVIPHIFPPASILPTSSHQRWALEPIRYVERQLL